MLVPDSNDGEARCCLSCFSVHPYSLVNSHNYGESSFLIGKSSKAHSQKLYEFPYFWNIMLVILFSVFPERPRLRSQNSSHIRRAMWMCSQPRESQLKRFSSSKTTWRLTTIRYMNTWEYSVYIYTFTNWFMCFYDWRLSAGLSVDPLLRRLNWLHSPLHPSTNGRNSWFGIKSSFNPNIPKNL